MTADPADGATATATDPATDGDSAAEVLLTTTPSARPTGVVLGAAVLAGLVAVGSLLATPEALGDPGTTRVGVYIVALVFALVVARLLVRIYLLTRFRYVLTERALRWEYSLFHRSRSRELPLGQLRGFERSQSRIQAALGVATVEFLTAANARGLGHLAFENVAESERLRRLVRDRVERERRRGRP